VPITWAIDTVPPDTTISSGPAALTNSTSADFTFVADDPAPSSGTGTFTYRLDGGPWTFAKAKPSKGSGPGSKDPGSKDPAPKGSDPASLSLTDLSEGGHTFEVAAIDGAGNTDPTPATYTWTIDLTPPTLSGPPTTT